MEPTLETIELDCDESNELLFKVQIEGIDSSPAKVRLVCESGDIGYTFVGKTTAQPDIVKFVLPVMKDKLKEGQYLSRVEVMIENRYFAPVQFNISFKKQVKVVAESVSKSIAKTEPTVTVSALPTVVKQVPKIKQEQPVVPVVKRQNESHTLRDRFNSKRRESANEEIADDEELRRLARSFIRSTSNK